MTKNKSVVEIRQKIILVRRSSVGQYKWCIDRWHQMLKKGRTVDYNLPEVVHFDHGVHGLPIVIRN